MLPEAQAHLDQLALLEQEQRLLQSLLAHPGWAVVCKALKDQSEALFIHAGKTDSAHNCAKFLGMCAALRDAAAFPDSRIRDIAMQLDAAETGR